MLLKQSTTITLISHGARSGGGQGTCNLLPSRGHEKQRHPKRHYHKHQRGHDRHPRSPSTSSSSSSHTPHDLHHWPSSPHPTPYEIFNIHRTAPYSKSRFYELVKLYHPDRSNCQPSHSLPPSQSSLVGSPISTLSPTTKLERYRLVVLAHSILSDPDRRRKYDAYGFGWSLPSSSFSIDPRGRYPDGKSWRDQPGNAANNATWEDWERWYQRRDGTFKSDPLYMSNGLFAAFVVLMTAMGAAGQYTWAENHARRMLMLKEEHHREIVRDLTIQQMNNDGFTEGEARIQAYLRRKEGSYYVPPTFR